MKVGLTCPLESVHCTRFSFCCRTLRVWCLKDKCLLHTLRGHDDDIEVSIILFTCRERGMGWGSQFMVKWAILAVVLSSEIYFSYGLWTISWLVLVLNFGSSKFKFVCFFCVSVRGEGGEGRVHYVCRRNTVIVFVPLYWILLVAL